MKKKTASPFATALRSAGFKATPGRLALLRLLSNSHKPLTVEEIFDAGIDADQATIYRSLKDLKGANIVRQVDLQHRHAHYELANINEHHHLICLSCGKIEDVHHCGIEAMENTVLRSSKHFAEIRQHTLEFYGICKSCAAR